MTMQNTQFFTRNLLGRDFVVGDIHAQHTAFMLALREVRFDFAKDRVFSVGDLIDRGPQNKLATQLLAQRWFFAVRGNHEQLVLDQFAPERVILRDRAHLTPRESHIKSDGHWFFELTPTEQRWYYRQFKALPYFIEIDSDAGRVGLCHAGVPAEFTDWQTMKAKSVSREIREAVLRNRSANSQNNAISGIGVTVHGHTGFKDIKQVNNSFWIDTFKKSGKITLLELNDLFARARRL
ncbi:serine/threonine protein phosphatase [Thiosulfatimonas sediminis]|uniref:Serine/threonine protein phosphatase n=1 Tax=Thiosulfatimonas sediminis TaxID=2675054 RepID=A0A6F8PUK5_9GAMM|nr:metallophosphoesterase [Thiosulfatimonas sediminis]BBP45688.1 serine/threonine protein phosphatase [Thiosulfatimonas sediminis]